MGVPQSRFYLDLNVHATETTYEGLIYECSKSSLCLFSSVNLCVTSPFNLSVHYCLMHHANSSYVDCGRISIAHLVIIWRENVHTTVKLGKNVNMNMLQAA